MRVISTQEILPMTVTQQQAIVRLCLILHIRQPIEEGIKSQAEAGKTIRELETEMKHRWQKAEEERDSWANNYISGWDKYDE